MFARQIAKPDKIGTRSSVDPAAGGGGEGRKATTWSLAAFNWAVDGMEGLPGPELPPCLGGGSEGPPARRSLPKPKKEAGEAPAPAKGPCRAPHALGEGAAEEEG